MNTATLDQEEQSQIEAIRARKAKERQHQEQVDRLQAAIDQARDRLSRATDFKNFAEQRIKELQQVQLDLVGCERIVTNVDPTSQYLDSLLTVLQLRAAISDFPRIAKHLQQQVEIASSRLAEFNKRIPE